MEATNDPHRFIYIDVVPTEPQMQFSKRVLAGLSREIRNMNKNQVNGKHGIKEDSGKEQKYHTQQHSQKTQKPSSVETVMGMSFRTQQEITGFY